MSGTEGSYVVPAMDCQERHLIEGRSPAGEPDGWGAEDEADWGWIQRGDTREAVPSERGRWDTYYPAFAAAVRGERDVPVDPADAVLALEVIEAAERSAEQAPSSRSEDARTRGRRRAPVAAHRVRPRGAGRALAAQRRAVRRSASARRRPSGSYEDVVQARAPGPVERCQPRGDDRSQPAGGRGPRRPPSCHACNRAADAANARTMTRGSSSASPCSSSSPRCSTASRRRSATANGEAPSVLSSQTAAVSSESCVHDRRLRLSEPTEAQTSSTMQTFACT